MKHHLYCKLHTANGLSHNNGISGPCQHELEIGQYIKIIVIYCHRQYQ